MDTIAAAREQGGLVGIPHPFDRYRNSLLREASLDSLAGLVDWVETWNARIVGRAGNEQAAAFALEHGLPGMAVSDAHSTLEVGVAYTSPPRPIRPPRPACSRRSGRSSSAGACLVLRPDPDAPRQGPEPRPGQDPDQAG